MYKTVDKEVLEEKIKEKYDWLMKNIFKPKCEIEYDIEIYPYILKSVYKNGIKKRDTYYGLRIRKYPETKSIYEYKFRSTYFLYRQKQFSKGIHIVAQLTKDEYKVNDGVSKREEKRFELETDEIGMDPDRGYSLIEVSASIVSRFLNHYFDGDPNAEYECMRDLKLLQAVYNSGKRNGEIGKKLEKEIIDILLGKYYGMRVYNGEGQKVD